MARTKQQMNSYKTFFEAIKLERFYQSGERFRAADIRPAVDRATVGDKLTTSSLHSIMRSMADAGLVEIVENSGPEGRYYRKPQEKRISKPWRSQYFEWERESLQ